MYVIEGYPEFEQDVKEIFNDLIIKNNFEVAKIDDGTVIIKNERCSIKLLLDIEQRIYYKFQNPKTLKQIDYITLGTYCGANFLFTNLVGGEGYPLTVDQWTDFYAEDDNRSICKVDLPIILREIEENFQFVIDGDFSWEENIDEWEGWCNAKIKSTFSIKHKDLSYQYFLKDQESKS